MATWPPIMATRFAFAHGFAGGVEVVVVEVKEEEVAKWGPSNFRGSWVRIYRQVSNLRPGWLSLIPSKAQIKVKPPWYQSQGPLSAVCTGTGMAVTRSHTGPVPVPVGVHYGRGTRHRSGTSRGI